MYNETVRLLKHDLNSRCAKTNPLVSKTNTRTQFDNEHVGEDQAFFEKCAVNKLTKDSYFATMYVDMFGADHRHLLL